MPVFRPDGLEWARVLHIFACYNYHLAPWSNVPMTNPDPKIIKSPLCRKFTSDGITVDVEIYRLENSEGWALELVDSDWNSTTWEDLFPTDQAAWDEFERGVKEIGLLALLEGDEDAPTIH